VKARNYSAVFDSAIILEKMKATITSDKMMIKVFENNCPTIHFLNSLMPGLWDKSHIHKFGCDRQ